MTGSSHSRNELSPGAGTPGGGWLPVAAVLTATLVFPLIVVGAGVTSTDSGMAYPDWPTSAGHLVNPPSWWADFNTRWEHGHRLIGWLVGMLAIVLAVGSWRRGGVARWCALATLLAISVQGILGGLRVREVSTLLALVHGIWGQACFCLACATALVVSPGWADQRARHEVRAATFLQRLCLAGTISVLVQLVLGATQRHFAAPAALVAHVLWAIVVSFILCWISMWLTENHSGRHLICQLGKTIGILTVVQLVLGGGAFLVTVVRGTSLAILPWLLPSLHVAVGALLLAGMVVLTVEVCHTLRPAPEPKRGPNLIPVAVS